MHDRLALALVAVLHIAFGSAADAQTLVVKDAWVRTAPPGAPTAAYMTIENESTTPAKIVRVASDDFGRAEMHETVMKKDVASMRPVDALEVPARGKVTLAPGGLHLMLYRPARAYGPGDVLHLTLHLEDGRRIPVVATAYKGRPADHAH